jgi:4-amino-4-deoxy-L-arabinose transferase-like glycosyltransferase
MFFEKICSGVVLGMTFATLGFIFFFIPIEFCSAFFSFSYNTTLWMHKAVLLLFFSFFFVAEYKC